MAKDYYQVLGVTRTASDAEIKKAFRKLAHEHHPDKAHGNEQKFKELNEAYQVLSNPEKRKRYDQFGAGFEQAGGSGGFSWQSTGGNPFGGFENFGQNAQFDFGDLGDILGGMFGFEQRSGGRGSRVRRGNDIETTITISFEDSYFGIEKEIELPMHLTCEHCSGSGNEPGAKVTTCTTCKGSGHITQVRNTMLGAMQTQTLCSVCEGVGSRADKKCTSCKGATLLRANQRIKVGIPAGIDATKSIRLAGKGEAGPHKGPRGDLYIKLRITDHPHFTRDGYDVRSTERVPYSILVNGGSVNVATPSGEVKLKIPTATESGKTFILKDKGFERLSGRGRGDQLVTVQAYVPRNLNSEQKKLLDAFEKALESRSGKKNWW